MRYVVVDRNTKQIDAGKTVILSFTTGTAVILLILTPVVKGNFINKGKKLRIIKSGKCSQHFECFKFILQERNNHGCFDN